MDNQPATPTPPPTPEQLDTTTSYQLPRKMPVWKILMAVLLIILYVAQGFVLIIFLIILSFSQAFSGSDYNSLDSILTGSLTLISLLSLTALCLQFAHKRLLPAHVLVGLFIPSLGFLAALLIFNIGLNYPDIARPLLEVGFLIWMIRLCLALGIVASIYAFVLAILRLKSPVASHATQPLSPPTPPAQ